MAEGEHAGKAEEEIERHRRQRVDHHAAAKLDIAANMREPERRGEQQQPDHGVAGALVELRHQKRPSSPRSPRGRMIKTAAIIT